MTISSVKQLLADNYSEIVENLDDTQSGNLPSIRDDLLTIQHHIEDDDIHVTEEIKEDNEYHINDESIHVTPAQKEKWDRTADGITAGQVTEIPEASALDEGKIIQYIGESTEKYTHGYFYQCQVVSRYNKYVGDITVYTVVNPQIGDVAYTNPEFTARVMPSNYPNYTIEQARGWWEINYVDSGYICCANWNNPIMITQGNIPLYGWAPVEVQDLSGYVKTNDLSEYAKTNDVVTSVRMNNQTLTPESGFVDLGNVPVIDDSELSDTSTLSSNKIINLLNNKITVGSIQIADAENIESNLMEIFLNND